MGPWYVRMGLSYSHLCPALGKCSEWEGQRLQCFPPTLCCRVICQRSLVCVATSSITKGDCRPFKAGWQHGLITCCIPACLDRFWIGGKAFALGTALNAKVWVHLGYLCPYLGVCISLTWCAAWTRSSVYSYNRAALSDVKEPLCKYDLHLLF